ncbi:MAG: DUF364 domain-containing protein [Oscillospiraceae bacterium]|jgi:uncharacterized protein (DUF4213/DUF364 family)|nr:DUF364 domain-containing protein [Oscillospiraceae bacterium]
MSWELYDALIDGISPNATVDRIICGATRTLVRSGESIGMAGTLEDTWRANMMPEKDVGMPLRELAQCIKSWEYTEAGIGLAAINAWYNTKDKLRRLGLEVSDSASVEDRAADPFITMQRDIKGKTVTVIGHFPYIDQLFAPVCDMRIIEKFSPKDGDYPEQAAEYLLPESDYVFISSYTLAEKTLPRYLELSQNAVVTLVGPATPVAPVLHGFGVRNIAGFAIKDADALERMILTSCGNTHKTGQKVNLRLGAFGEMRETA